MRARRVVGGKKRLLQVIYKESTFRGVGRDWHDRSEVDRLPPGAAYPTYDED